VYGCLQVRTSGSTRSDPHLREASRGESLPIGTTAFPNDSLQPVRDNPPCVDICPTNAMFQRADGIVDFNRGTCIGCKACIAACPYDAIYIDPESHSAEKCNFCTHRFNQAKGRDLWQNQLLSVHLLSYTLLAGSAALSFQGAFITLSDNDTTWIQMVFGVATSVLLLLVLIEWRMPHPTEAARYASREMTQGKWAYCFWGGLALAVTSLLVLMIVRVPWVAAVLGLAGLALHQRAYVQAGQSAPQVDQWV
jgi:hypothetical protein